VGSREAAATVASSGYWIVARTRELLHDGVLGWILRWFGFADVLGPTPVPSWQLALLMRDGWFCHEAAAADLGYAPRVRSHACTRRAYHLVARSISYYSRTHAVVVPACGAERYHY
jgi:hypothetical protein